MLFHVTLVLRPKTAVIPLAAIQCVNTFVVALQLKNLLVFKITVFTVVENIPVVSFYVVFKSVFLRGLVLAVITGIANFFMSTFKVLFHVAFVLGFKRASVPGATEHPVN